MPRAPRSAAVPDVDTRNTTFVPAAASTVPPPVSTLLAQQTSVEAFIDALLSTPSTHTGAARDHLQELPRIVPTETDSYIPIQTFWYLFPKGENLYRSLGFERECLTFCSMVSRWFS